MCYHLCAVEFRGQGRPLGVLSRRIPCREQLTYIYICIQGDSASTLTPNFSFNNEFIQHFENFGIFNYTKRLYLKVLGFFNFYAI